MAGIKFTQHSYKIQSKKRLEEKSGAGMVLRKLVSIENVLVMNESQFRFFYKQFTGHELLGGDYEDINCMKLQLCKELMSDIVGHIDERGVFDDGSGEETEVKML